METKQKSKIPVIKGFILPNKQLLHCGGAGHCETAASYVQDMNLYDDFKKSQISSEDDYLVDNYGAIKIGTWDGHNCIFVSRKIESYKDLEVYLEDYLKKVVADYISEGYPVYNTVAKCILENKKSHKYNTTVIKNTAGYTYNPNRDGD